MGYMVFNTNVIVELESLDTETEQHHIESLQLTDAEKAELNAE